jgi:hypothetical protein
VGPEVVVGGSSVVEVVVVEAFVAVVVAALVLVADVDVGGGEAAAEEEVADELVEGTVGAATAALVDVLLCSVLMGEAVVLLVLLDGDAALDVVDDAAPLGAVLEVLVSVDVVVRLVSVVLEVREVVDVDVREVLVVVLVVELDVVVEATEVLLAPHWHAMLPVPSPPAKGAPSLAVTAARKEGLWRISSKLTIDCVALTFTLPQQEYELVDVSNERTSLPPTASRSDPLPVPEAPTMAPTTYASTGPTAVAVMAMLLYSA